MDDFNFVNNDKVLKLEPVEGMNYETNGMCEEDNQLTDLANVVKSETVKSESINKKPFRSRILFEEDIFGDIKKEDILNEINKISDYIDETENIDCNTGKVSPAKDSEFLVDSNEDSEFAGDVLEEKPLHSPMGQRFSDSNSETAADFSPGPSINEKPLSPPSPPTLSYLSSMLNPGPSTFNFLVDYNEKDSTRTKKPLHPSKRRRLDPHSEAVAEVLPGTSIKSEPSLSPPSSPTPSYLSSMLNPGPSTLKLCRPKDVEDSNQSSAWDVDFSTLLAYGSDNSDAEDDGEFPDVSHDRVDMDAFFIDEEESATQALKTEPLCELTSPVIGPTNLFNFEWQDFPNPPVPPTERQEVFSDFNSGPTAPYRTPYDAFTAIWNLDIMEYIVLETNRYAQQVADKQYRDGSLGPNSRIALWQDTNVNELYVFFALILGSALCIKGELKDYWSKEGPIATPYFGQYMSYNRFTLLCRCIHFNNNTSDIQAMTRSQAKIFKIAPVVQHLNQQFQSLYNLNRNIALDESLTQWKGWLDITQFIKNKGGARGIKTYQVCDAETGYLWRLKVNAGREEGVASETPELDVTECPVLELLEGLENKGHTVWMDNYYNSPALARVLKSLGFDCVGTLRTNRQFVPPQLANLKKSDMAVGQISGLTSGDVDVMVWRDKNRVGLISTYHGAGVYTNKEGLVKPTVVRDYNRWMGGVDKRNQTLSAYPLERKRTQVWYKKLFKRLLNISILNAFILYQHNSLDKQSRGCKHREFRKTLFNEILATNYCPPTSRSLPNFNNIDSPEISMEFLDHLPTEYGLLKAKRMKGREKLRRACAVCHRRISMHCSTCNVPLCLITCFKKYHINKFILSK